jgi:hypothetical protein
MNFALSNIFINKIFSNDVYTKNIFKGFLYPRGNNNIQKEIAAIQPPALYVCNTDWKSSSGIHWLLILYLSNLTIFFDPFGFSEQVYNLPFIVERGSIPVQRNIFTVQNWDTRSVACGHFVLIYGLLLARGHTLNDINNIFLPNTESNDSIAINLISWLKRKMYL